MQTIARKTLKMAAAFLLVIAVLSAGIYQGTAMAAPAQATVQFDLWATTGTLSLPGGGSMPIWGYADSAGGTAGMPGPAMVVNEGDLVVVNLTNSLGEPTALLFQGQDMIPDSTGVFPGGSKSYSFVASRPGTYLYEAGLLANAQHQVAMGMFGVLIVRPAATGQAYGSASTAYDDEAVLVLSEIDPALNNSLDPAGFDMREFHPRYWFFNGKAYPETDPIPTVAGHRVLLRYVNAGLLPHSMGLLGLRQEIIALDGSPLQFPHTVVAETIAPGQTMDTITTIPAAAELGSQFALFEADFLQHNNNAAGFGGMLTFLTTGTPPPPGGDAVGPITSATLLTPNKTNGSTDILVTASVSDASAGGSTIQVAEFYIDSTSGTFYPMQASDTAYDSSIEGVEGTISVADMVLLSTGTHTVYVRGLDSAGNWGAFNSAVFNLDKTGPAVSALVINPVSSNGTMNVSLSATADDRSNGNSNIVAAEYNIDGGPAVPMSINAAAPIASLTATIPAATVAALSDGTHSVSVRAQDELGNWGAETAIEMIKATGGPSTSAVNVNPNPSNGLIGFNSSTPAVRVTASFADASSKISAAEGFIDAVGADGSGFPFIATDGVFNSLSESGYADIPLTTISLLSEGSHTIYVHAKNAAGNWGDLSSVELVVDRTKPVFGAITVTPPNATRGGGTVTVTVSGSVTDNLSGVNLTSGTYTMADSKSNAVVNGTFTIAPDGSFSFSLNISRSNNGQNTVANRRYYTFTIYVKDNAGNIKSTTAQFYIQ